MCYDPSHYLLLTAELPLVGHVLDASKEQPYLSLRLELDPTLVGSVMVETDHPSLQNQADVRALNVSSLDAELLDAVVRLVRLVDTPAEAPFLAPLITREIIYRLWMGEQGDRLSYIAALSGYTPHWSLPAPPHCAIEYGCPTVWRGWISLKTLGDVPILFPALASSGETLTDRRSFP
jgi:hypothetical protein